MPSSPELVDVSDPARERPHRFEPIVLGDRPGDIADIAAVAATPPPLAVVGSKATKSTWSFEAAFPPANAPEPFVVSDRVGVPPAVMIEARRAARSEGYAAGFASGISDARQQSAAEDATRRAQAESADAAARVAVDRAIDALRTAAADLAGRAATAHDDLERLVLDSAYDLAEALLGSALRDDAVRGTAAVRRALALVPAGSAAVTVALHPGDAATVAATGGLGDDVRVVADASLAPGDAVASTGDTTVESRLADGLARAREVLGR